MAGPVVPSPTRRPDELGDVLDLVDDEAETSRRVEDGPVHEAPEPLLVAAALGVPAPDVVPLHDHRVGDPGGPDLLERGPQVVHAAGRRIAWVVREDLEEVAPDDRRPLHHRRLEVGVARGDDPQVRVQHKVATRDRLEDRAEFWLAGPPGPGAESAPGDRC